MTLGANVRDYRKKRGLSQKQLAQQAHISANYIWYIETERRPRVGAKVVASLANALDVTVEELLTEGDFPLAIHDTRPVYEVNEAEIDDELLRLYHGLSFSDRNLLLLIAQRLAEQTEPRIIGDLPA
jgi:transcriptional regulator with XRE-family HTH domain